MLPSVDYLLCGIFLQRALKEDKTDDADESEETLTCWMFILATWEVFAREAKSASTKDNRLPRNFNEDCQEQN